MNIAICDDDSKFSELLENLVTDYFSKSKTDLPTFSRFSSGEELLEDNGFFDLIFLDIEMKQIDGISAGQELKKRNPNSIIFIITSYECYLDDAFKINAFRFLTKPPDVTRLHKALDDAMELLNNGCVAFHDIKSSLNVSIQKNEIIFIEAENKKVKIETVNGTFYSSDTLSAWKNRLSSSFFVCPHASYIVNLNYLYLHSRTQLTLVKKDINGNITNKYNINIAPKKQTEIRSIFFKFSERR